MPSELTWAIIRPWLSDAGSVASIFGVLASAYVVYGVWRLRTRFLFTARMPEVHKALSECSREVSTALGDFPESKHALDAVLVRSCALLTTAMKLSNGAPSSAKRVRKEIQKVRKTMGKDELWSVYSEIQGLLEELKQQLHESKWDHKA